MIVTVLSIASAGSDEIAVTLELCEGDSHCKERFVISTDAYTRLNISKGECNREKYDEIESEAKIHSAFKRGLYLLGFGASSKKNLLSKLIAKRFDKESAEIAVDRIEACGYLCESASASREAEICAAKLWGETRIRAQLMQKGYSKESADEAIYALLDSGIDFEENCKSLIKKKCDPLPSDRTEMQKLIFSLMRYGYSISQIKSACSSLIVEE